MQRTPPKDEPKYGVMEEVCCLGKRRTRVSLPPQPANSHQVLTGVQSHDVAEETGDVEQGSEKLFVVGFQGPNDALNPQNWSRTRKWVYTSMVGATGFLVSGASAFDTEIAPQAAKYFGVSEEVELLSTSLYMIAFGLGSLVSAPFSETVGRNPVYIICKPDPEDLII